MGSLTRQPAGSAGPAAHGALIPFAPLAPPSGPDARTGGDAGGPTAAAFVRGVRRRWVLAAVLAVVGLAAGAAAGWTLTAPRTTVRTLLRTDSDQQSLLSRGSEVRGNFQYFQRTQLVLVRSRMVLNAALRQPEVADLAMLREHPDPVPWLEKELKADYALAPEILRLSMSGEDPRQVAILLNAVREAYLREIVEKEHRDRAEKIEKLQALYTQYEALLADRRKALADLARTVGAQDGPTLALKQHLALERVGEARKQLVQLQGNLYKAQAEAAALEARARGVDDVPVAEAAVDAELKKDKRIEHAQAEVEKLESQLDDMRQKAARGDDEPALAAPKARVAAARAALAAERAKARPAVAAALKQKARAEARTAAAEHKGQVDLLAELAGMLAKDADRFGREAEALNQKAIDLGTVRDGLAKDEEMLKKVGAQVDALKVEQMAPPRVTLLEEAVAEEVAGPKKRFMAAAAGAACLAGLFVLGLAWREVRSGKIGTVAEVRQVVDVPVVGTVPAVPARVNRLALRGAAGAGRGRGQELIESVDAARTLLTALAGGAQAVMITSAGSGEGKTSLSGHLATSLARAGYQTLLIDGDLRRPTAQATFGLDPEAPGLSEVLRGGAKVRDAIHPTGVDGLGVMPAGSPDRMTFRALARGQTRVLYDLLKQRFDFVLVDSAPVLAVADSLMLALGADGVLLSVMQDVSRAPAVLAACERLSLMNVRILGTVVTGVREGTYGYGYQYAR